MPMKKDETGKRWVEMDLTVPGTPEQVWHAIATGPGTAAWFTNAEIEPRVGGKVLFDFGSEEPAAPGEVTTWEPPHRFGYVERDWAPGSPPLATEITIIARSGDQCVVRMVHSLFSSTDDWDDQLDGFEKGWVGFFVVLRLYLQHFAGAHAASCGDRISTTDDALSSWRRLGEALGLANANVGERRAGPLGSDSWSGVVEHIHQDAEQRFVVVRLDAPAPGILLAGIYCREASTTVSVTRFFYGADADARARDATPRVRAWLGSTFGTEQKT